MPKRNPQLLVEDILTSISYVQEDVKGLTYETFLTSRKGVIPLKEI